MSYARPPFPRDLFKFFNEVAQLLGWGVRGQRWNLLWQLLHYAKAHPDLFRKR